MFNNLKISFDITNYPFWELVYCVIKAEKMAHNLSCNEAKKLTFVALTQPRVQKREDLYFSIHINHKCPFTLVLHTALHWKFLVNSWQHNF